MSAYDDFRAKLEGLDAALKRLPTKSDWAICWALAMLAVVVVPAWAFVIYRWLEL